MITLEIRAHNGQVFTTGFKSELWDALAPVRRVLAIHANHRDKLNGLPFDIINVKR